MLKIAEYDLGHETEFVIVAELIDTDALKDFESMVTNMALGFTVYRGIGGWKGVNEDILIYRIASLDNYQRQTLTHFLLHNTGMKDLYVVLPGGMAKGYCLETDPYVSADDVTLDAATAARYRADRMADDKPLTQPKQFNSSRGLPYRPGSTTHVLHGTRDTGWPRS